MEKARYTLEQTKTSVKSTLDKAILALEKAQEDLAEAQEDLANAVITAPFDGFITTVSVEGGDEIQRGTIAAQLADPAKFEAEIMVGERDIFQVKEGGTATIQIDAAPAIVLTATVTHISPTATIQSGVVNYKVKVEADSSQTPPVPGQQVSSGSGQSRSSSGSGQRSQTGGGTAQVSLLREGLSVTVNILVSEAKNVLLVPNGAIIRSGREVQVQVMKNGVPEKRVIKTGISNWQYIEVTEGVSEGEKVIIPKVTATATPTSTSSGGQSRPIFIPR
jgi:hypothetical protein